MEDPIQTKPSLRTSYPLHVSFPNSTAFDNITRSPPGVLGNAGQGCATASDGSRIASCSDVDRVRIWETRTRQCVAQLHTSRDIKAGAVI